jgi:protein TonB
MFSNLLKTTVTLLIINFSLFYTSTLTAFEIELQNGESLERLGIAIHQEKRNDIYLGTLFASKEITDVSQLFDNSISKRMSFKFLSQYSNRKLARLWKQRIAMNNSKEIWRPLTKQIIQFSNLFKRAMKESDEINIDFIATKGTSIYLNKTLFLTIDDERFYELLLNVWIGPIPPTESFKTGITGNNTAFLNEQLTEKFNQLNPDIGRFDADKIIIKKPIKIAKKANSIKIKSKETKPNIIQPKKNSFSNETKYIVDNLLSTQAINTPIVKTSIEKTSENTEDLFKIDLGLPQKTTEILNNESNSTLVDKAPNIISSTDNSQLKLNTESLTEEPVEKQVEQIIIHQERTAALDLSQEAELPEEDFFDADLLIGSYTLELINNVRLKQSYPPKAHRAGQEGNLTVQIKINKQGEIISNNLVVRSGSRFLDRGVLRMVKKAAPFPVIPEELELNEFEFEVSLSFIMAK